jgi:PAS domain S-box-containing protein
LTARNLALGDNPNRAASDSEFLPPVRRANWLLLVLGFVLVAVCGYLLLRDWFDVAAHHVYAVGLAVLLGIFTIVNRHLAESARELRAAIIRADKSLSAARAAEAKYRSIFENAGEGIFQVAPDGRYLAANPALARILGYASPEDLIRGVKSIYALLCTDPARRENFLRAMEGKGEVAGFESEIRRPDGSLAWISENIHAVRDEHGVVSYYEGTVAEITDRRRIETERELRQERELRHQRCLLELSQFDKSDCGRALAVLVETTSCTLGVARTSVWRLVEKDTEHEAIMLPHLFELLKKEHVTDEFVLKASNFPRYFAALRRRNLHRCTQRRNRPPDQRIYRELSSAARHHGDAGRARLHQRPSGRCALSGTHRRTAHLAG